MIDDKKTSLNDVENELSLYINNDNRNWMSFYELVERVKVEKLFLEKGLKSFNAWVNTFASEVGVGTSLIWRKYKAGRTIKESEERTGRSFSDSEIINVSPDTIASIETLAGKDSIKMDSLLKKAMAGEISRADVRLALKEKRLAGGFIPKSRHEKINPNDRHAEISNILASDIVLELSRWDWLSDFISCDIKTNNPIKRYLYHIETELGVVTGTSQHKRRFDAIAFENLTIDNSDNYGINTFGFEIKVTKGDLIGDTKMQEYTNFCDFFSIAIPKSDELITIAQEIKAPDWGIIVCDPKENNQLKFVERPKKLKPIFKDKLFENLILRLLSKSADDFK